MTLGGGGGIQTKKIKIKEIKYTIYEEKGEKVQTKKKSGRRGGWKCNKKERKRKERKEGKERKKEKEKKEEEEEEKRKGTRPASCSGRTRTGSERNCTMRGRCLPTSILFYA